MYLPAELLRDDAAHNVEKIFAGFFEDEGVFGVGPAELEAGGEGGNPDFANGSVWGNDEFGFFGFLEDDLELATFAFHVEAVFVAESEQAALEVVESGVGFSLEVFFVHTFRISELRFDGFGDFVVADDSGDALDDFAVAADENAGGVTEQAAEFVGRGVVADDDRVVHLGFRTLDVKALLVDPGSHHAGAFFVHSDAEHGEAPGRVLLLHFDEPGNFDLTRLAPGGPEIDEDYLAFVLSQGEIFAVEIFQRKVRGGLCSSIANGNFWNAALGLARGAVREICGGDDGDDRDDDQQRFLQRYAPPDLGDENIISQLGEHGKVNGSFRPGQGFLKPQNDAVEKAKLSGHPRQAVGEDQAADKKKQSAAEEFDGVEMLSEALVEAQELANAQSGEQERHGQARGVNSKEENAAGDGVTGGGEGEDGGEDWSDAGSPAERKGKAEEKTAPDAGLRAAGAEANVAIEPAGHGRAKEADKGKREKVDEAETSDEWAAA